MADTSNLGITKPTPGGDAGTWGATLNTGADNFDTAVAGTLSKSVAGSANVSLTDAEALNANHIYTGELTGNIAVHVPIKSRRYQVFNNTTGSFTLKVKTSSETNGTTIGQGETLVLMCDGTSVISGVTGAAATSVSDFTTNNLKVLTCASATNLVAATGSFTTKVSGVAAEFSGHVSAAEFYGGGANITGITAPTSVDEYKVNELTVVSLAHVEKGDAGSVTANALANELVIENSDHAGLSILTPADKHGYVMFGDPGSNSAGQIQYDHGTPAWQYSFEGSNRMYFNSSETVFNDGGGNFDIRVEGDTDTSLFKVDAGNEQIELGGNTIPDADGTLNLGSAAAQWNQVYMQYPTLWERRLNIILLGVLNFAGTMKMFVSGHCWDPATGNTTLNPDMNDSVTGDFVPEALDASTGFNSKPAGYKASNTDCIVLNTDDMGSGEFIGQVITSKVNMTSTYAEGLTGMFRCHSNNFGGTTAYRPEVNFYYNGGNALYTDTTRYPTSKYAYWSVFFYAK